MNRPTLYTLSKGREVRHLLIEGDDPGAMTLSHVINGVRTVLAKGTSYEMNKRADDLWQEWMKGERFEYQKDGQFTAYESLQAAVAIALLMRYTVIHDPKCVNPRNPLGVVPLVEWEGWTDTNGDSYMYSLNDPSLYGRPDVTARHRINLTPKNNAEMIETLTKVGKIEKTLGPAHTFVLG
jgi:hypothetical protein